MSETRTSGSPPDTAREWSSVSAAWEANADYADTQTAAPTDALLGQVAITPGDRVLELGCGPGSLGATLSSLVGPDGHVVLSDISPAMVEVARGRNAGLDNVATEVLDASAIDRPDGSFDVAVARTSLMFTPDPAAAFAEIGRVLALGGRVGAVTWAGLEHNPWITCVGMAVMSQGLGDGPPIGPGGIFSLGDPAVLESLVTGAGFADVVVEAHDVVFPSPSTDDHIDRVIAMAGPLAAILEAATPDQRAAVRKTAADFIAPHVAADGTVAIGGRALVVVGRH